MVHILFHQLGKSSLWRRNGRKTHKYPWLAFIINNPQPLRLSQIKCPPDSRSATG